MANLTDLQRAILKAINRSTGAVRSGFAVGDIAFLVGRQLGHESNRAHSALVSRECKALEKAGLLCQLDDEKPIVWCIADGVALGPTLAAEGSNSKQENDRG
jgi:hypothetical protein